MTSLRFAKERIRPPSVLWQKLPGRSRRRTLRYDDIRYALARVGGTTAIAIVLGLIGSLAESNRQYDDLSTEAVPRPGQRRKELDDKVTLGVRPEAALSTTSRT